MKEFDYRKVEMAVNRFLAWLFGIMAVIAIIGIFWNPAQFIVSIMCALMCAACIREVRINKDPKPKKK